MTEARRLVDVLLWGAIFPSHERKRFSQQGEDGVLQHSACLPGPHPCARDHESLVARADAAHAVLLPRSLRFHRHDEQSILRVWCPRLQAVQHAAPTGDPLKWVKKTSKVCWTHF